MLIKLIKTAAEDGSGEMLRHLERATTARSCRTVARLSAGGIFQSGATSTGFSVIAHIRQEIDLWAIDSPGRYTFLYVGANMFEKCLSNGNMVTHGNFT